MHAVWTRLRRYVASAMLAAMVSFVFHGGGMAGMDHHAPGAPECASHASSGGHVHAAVDQHDADQARDAGDRHAHGGHHDGADGDGKESAAADLCCGSVCSIAISTAAPQTVGVPMASLVVPMREAAERPDNRPDGLKRPPRTSDIA